MFIHTTVGRFLSLSIKHSSIVFASCSRKCISSYSTIVIFTFSVFFSPIWMSVPGVSPVFFDLFFVNFAIWTNLILDLRLQISNVNFVFQQSVCGKVFTKGAVRHIRQMEIMPTVRVMFGWIHIDRLVYAAVNR